MNEKFTIQELIGLLAQRHDMKQADAEVFVKTLFALIEEALASDKYVKIKGLGTFKLIDVDRRESVDVNTGERIEIQGHSKIVFQPDLKMRDTVNKPFSHFETVLLNDGVRFDDMAEDNKPEESPAETKEDVPESKPEVEQTPSEQPSEQEQKPVPESVETIKEDSLEKEKTEVTVEHEPEPLEGETKEDNHKSKFGFTTLLIIITLLLGIIIGGGIVWLILTRQQMLSNSMEQAVKEEQPVLLEDSVKSDSILSQTDSVALVSDTVSEEVTQSKVESEVSAKTEAQKETLADTIEYKIVGTRTTYTIKNGESLVRVSLKFYGTKKLWPYIAQYNKDLLKNADDVSAGTVIRVPELKPKE